MNEHETPKQDRTQSPFSALHHVSIVMEDVEKAVQYYESIGFGPFEAYPPLKDYIHIHVPDEDGFYDIKVRCAQIGSVQLQLIQPGKGQTLYKDFLTQKGPGVFHLGFVVENLDQAEDQLVALGLKVISSGRRQNGSGFVYLNTAADGGVTLLVRQNPS